MRRARGISPDVGSEERLKRAAVYLRVSTEEQARGGFSLQAQEKSCAAYAASQRWDVVGVYADEGYSGKDLRRPQLQRLLGDAIATSMDIILVWRLDRLSRRQADVMHLIQDVFAPAQVGFMSATEPFDTTHAAGLAMVGMLAVFAQLERETIIERTRMGLSQRTSNGLWSGSAPWGYRYRGDGVLEPDPAIAPWVSRVFELAADPVDGRGIEAIAAWLATHGIPAPHGRRTWHMSTVRIILGNRAYLGQRRHHGGWVTAAHEPVISEDLFLRVQRAISERRTGGRPRPGEEVDYALTGAAYCGHCGGRLRGKNQKWSNGTHRRYYVCRNRFSGDNADCPFGWQSVEKIEGAVLRSLGEAGADVAQARAAVEQATSASPDEPTRQVDAVRRALATCEDRIRRLLQSVEQGWLSGPEVGERMGALRNERAELQARAAALELDISGGERPDPERVVKLLVDLRQLWDLSDVHQRRALLRGVVRRILVWRDARVQIEYRGA